MKAVTASLLVALNLSGVSRVAEAQAVRPELTTGTRAPAFETRQQLQAEAALLDQQGRTGEAWLRRSRLATGDFREGDRIVLLLEGGPVVEGFPIAKDTLAVRAGKVLQLPRMGDLSLEGVLRSELSDVLQTHIAKFIKNPVVRATPLLSLAVTGSVGAPGYYYMPADIVLRDVIMLAGGPASTADLDKVAIRRDGETIWKPADVRIALSDGLSLDRLHLRAGDVVVVPERRKFQFGTVTMVISTATTLALVIANYVR